METMLISKFESAGLLAYERFKGSLSDPRWAWPNGSGT